MCHVPLPPPRHLIGVIVDKDRLQTISTVTKHTEQRKAAQRPCNVVDENVFSAEQDRGFQDAVRQSRVNQLEFQCGLAAEVLEIAVLRTPP